MKTARNFCVFCGANVNHIAACKRNQQKNPKKHTQRSLRRRNNEPSRERSNRDTNRQPRYALTVQNVEENSAKENRKREKDEHFSAIFSNKCSAEYYMHITSILYRHIGRCEGEKRKWLD